MNVELQHLSGPQTFDTAVKDCRAYLVAMRINKGKDPERIPVRPAAYNTLLRAAIGSTEQPVGLLTLEGVPVVAV